MQAVFKLVHHHALEVLHEQETGSVELLERYCRSLHHNFQQEDRRIRTEAAALSSVLAHDRRRLATDAEEEKQLPTAAGLPLQSFGKIATIRQRQRGVECTRARTDCFSRA